MSNNSSGLVAPGKSSKRTAVKKFFRRPVDSQPSGSAGQNQSPPTPFVTSLSPVVTPYQNITTPSPPNAALNSISSNGSPTTVGHVSGGISSISSQVEQTRWEQAKGRVPLPERDAIDFNNLDKLTILQEVKDAARKSQDICTSKQWKIQWKGREIALRDVAGNLISLVDKFAQIGDFVVQYDPVHAALPWAAFRLLFQFAMDDVENMGRILIGLDKAAQCIDRCAIYERLYLSGQVVSDVVKEHERAIVDLYTAVLTFQASAIVFYRRSTFVRGMRAIFDEESFQAHLAVVEEKETFVQSSAVLVEAEYQRSTGDTLNQNLSKNQEELKAMLSALDATLVTEVRGVARQIVDLSQSFSNVQISKESEFINRQLGRLPLAEGAAFNSYENERRVECLENTRVDLLHGIQEWRDSLNGPCIFWLNGMAGTGKSTIAKTIARTAHEQNYLGASFFFTRGGGDRGNAAKFFSTIAFQMANTIPNLKAYISEAISAPENFDILERGLRDHWKILILEPLIKLTDQSTTSNLTLLVIDALDECDGEHDVRLILQLLGETKDLLGKLKFRVFLTSRPETPIRYGFSKIASKDHTDVVLHNVSQSIIEHDISLYFYSEFKKIRDARHHLPREWPGTQAIQDLVQRADKLFIYAATICRFIERSPEKRLSLLLQASASGQSYTWTLDQMYIQVLKGSVLGDCNPREEEELAGNFRDIVGSLVVLFDSLSTAALSQLIGEEPNVVVEILESLGSLVDVSENRDIPIRLIHLSFYDFLLDNQRCSNPLFWIDKPKQHSQLLTKCLAVMSKNLRRDACSLRMPGVLASEVPMDVIEQFLSTETQYACQYWVRHFQQSGAMLEENCQVHKFLREHFLHWLEALSLIKILPESIHMIAVLRTKLSVDNASKFSALLFDANRFILHNRSIIEIYPLQTYYSALIFSPHNSIIRRKFSGQLPNWISQPQVRQNWNPCLQTLEGHSDRMKAVAFSLDGKFLASASYDKTIKLWDPTTGVLLQTLVGHSSGVTSVAFSPDDKILASSSFDETVKLWDHATGALLDTLEGHSDSVTAVAFSHSGKVASASNDGTVKVWDPTTGMLLYTLEGHLKEVEDVTFSPDSKVLASASRDKTIKLWNPVTGVLLDTFVGHSRPVATVAFSPDGKVLASASRDKTIKLWNPVQGVLLNTLVGHSDDVEAVTFSPDGKVLASVSCDKAVKLWDPTIGVILVTLEDHSHWVTAVTFSPDGKILASASFDKTIKLWNPSTGVVPDALENHSDVVATVVFSPDGKVLASASYDRTIKLWDPTTGILLHTLEGHSNLVMTVVFSPNGKILASTSYDRTVKIWSPATGVLAQTLEHFDSGVKAVVFSPDSKVLVSTLEDNRIKLWNATTGVVLDMLEGHCDSVEAVAFSPDGKVLASASKDKTIKLWHPASGTLLDTLVGHSKSVVALAFSPNGKVLASASRDKTLKLWDPATGKIIQTFEFFDEERNFKLSFTSAGPYLYTNQGLIYPEQQGIAFKQQNSSISCCGIQREWVTWKGQNILWLPLDYRPTDYEVRDDIIAQGHVSGQVTFIEINQKDADRVLRLT